MADLYIDDFESTTTGTLPSGWANVVGTWAVGTTEPFAGTKSLVNTSNAFNDLARFTGMSPTANLIFEAVLKATQQNFNTIGLCVRMSSTDKSCYVLTLEYGEIPSKWSLQISKQDSVGGLTLLGTRTDLTGLVTSGSFYKMDFTTNGNTLEGRIWEASAGTRPTTPSITYTDASSPYTTGVVGLLRVNFITGGNDGSSRGIDNLHVYTTAVNQITLSGPSAGPTNVASSNFTVGSTQGVTSSTIVTPSDNGGGGSFTPTTVTLTAGSPTATFTYTPTTVGSKTISITNNQGIANPSNLTYVVANNSLLDSNIFYSPYNWDYNNSKKITTCAGAYIKLAVTGTTSVSFTFDNSLGGNGMIVHSLNGGSFSAQTALSGSSPVYTISGLTPGVVTNIKLVIDTISQTDRWNTPSSGAFLTNIDIGSGTLSAPTLKTKRAIWFGDSISEGQATLSASTGSAVTSAVLLSMDALDAEYGVVGYGFQGYVHVGNGNVPAYNTAYQSHYQSRSRLSGGVLVPAPDMCIIWHGANDMPTVGVTLSTGDVNTALVNMRTICGSLTKIYDVVPVGGFNRSTITSAVGTYQTNTPLDNRTFLIDLGTSLQVGLDNTTGANANSYDGVHPKASRNVDIATAIVAGINAAVSGVNLDTVLAMSAALSNTLTISQASMWDEIAEGTYTFRDIFLATAAVLLGKAAGMNTNSPVFRDLMDSKDRVTATTDDNGNRSTVTINKG